MVIAAKSQFPDLPFLSIWGGGESRLHCRLIIDISAGDTVHVKPPEKGEATSPLVRLHWALLPNQAAKTPKRGAALIHPCYLWQSTFVLQPPSYNLCVEAVDWKRLKELWEDGRNIATHRCPPGTYEAGPAARQEARAPRVGRDPHTSLGGGFTFLSQGWAIQLGFEPLLVYIYIYIYICT